MSPRQLFVSTERPSPVARSRRLGLVGWLLLAGLAGTAGAEERFPPPEFTTGHQLPETEVAEADPPWQDYLDAAVLVGALGVGSYLALRSRSRRGVFFLTIFSVAYFGFWRKGCVCPIGAIQNVTLALFQPGYAIPASVAFFFILPLAFALFFGRSFCGGVCPLGAIQDLVLVRSVRVPRWLEQGLRVLAYTYLGLAILLAATASLFVICKYDPFVAFFRLGGSSGLLLLGAGFLVVGMFVGRPYCRFLCPLGVLLGHASRVSRWSVTITPDMCVRCNLCKEECPFGAIDPPAPGEAPGAPRSRAPLARAAGLLLLIPALAALGGFLGAAAAGPLSRINAKVSLSERLWLEEEGRVEGTTESSDAFRTTGRAARELHVEALAVREMFDIGAPILGAFLGLVVGLKLFQASVPRRNKDYEARRSACLACGRCFFYCPQEHERLKGRGIAVSPESVSRQL